MDRTQANSGTRDVTERLRFDEAALDAAIADYAGRQRRFGKTPEQLTPGKSMKVA